MVLVTVESQLIQVKGQFLKAWLPSNSIYDSNSYNDNNDDDDKVPIVVTLLGIVTDVSDVHSLKTSLPSNRNRVSKSR